MSGPATLRPVRVGHIDLSFHDASAAVVEEVLAAHGHTVERSAAPHEEMFRRLGAGEIDFLVSAWLPASHGEYLRPFAEATRRLTVLYEPYCIWGVPDYVPEADVAGIADLLHPAVAARMAKRIQGINPGAGISRFSQAIVERYGLADAGYYFETGTESDCFGCFERAVAEGRWIVIPLWHPQALHYRYSIRALAEPKGLLGGNDQATLIVRRDAEPRLGRMAIAELERLTIGNARLSALDDALRRRLGLDRDNGGTPCAL